MASGDDEADEGEAVGAIVLRREARDDAALDRGPVGLICGHGSARGAVEGGHTLVPAASIQPEPLQNMGLTKV